VVFPTAHLVTFALLAFALIVIPGPNVLFVISRSLQLGRAAGLAAVLGGLGGVYLQVVAVALGIGTLVEKSVAVFDVLKLAGAAYLIYLGVQAVRHRRSLAGLLEAPVQQKSTRRILTDGLAVGVTNPKPIVFFTAVLPQFVTPSAGHVPLQMLVLGSVFIGIALVSDSTWAVIAGTARAWFARSPRRLELVGGTGGLMMIGIGASLALTGRKN
jgi:threonine/homoserine/homoserine lactone efflux protein